MNKRKNGNDWEVIGAFLVAIGIAVAIGTTGTPQIVGVGIGAFGLIVHLAGRAT